MEGCYTKNGQRTESCLNSSLTAEQYGVVLQVYPCLNNQGACHSNVRPLIQVPKKCSFLGVRNCSNRLRSSCSCPKRLQMSLSFSSQVEFCWLLSLASKFHAGPLAGALTRQCRSAAVPTASGAVARASFCQFWSDVEVHVVTKASPRSSSPRWKRSKRPVIQPH